MCTCPDTTNTYIGYQRSQQGYHKHLKQDTMSMEQPVLALMRNKAAVTAPLPSIKVVCKLDFGICIGATKLAHDVARRYIGEVEPGLQSRKVSSPLRIAANKCPLDLCECQIFFMRSRFLRFRSLCFFIFFLLFFLTLSSCMTGPGDAGEGGMVVW